MKQSDLITAIAEARRFIAAALVLRDEHREEWKLKYGRTADGKNASATKRASMDLTRALATIRRIQR